jgi:hypothetical protein
MATVSAPAAAPIPNAQLGAEIQMRVAGKALDHARRQGAAVVQMLQDAAAVQQTHTPDPTRLLDIRA